MPFGFLTDTGDKVNDVQTIPPQRGKWEAEFWFRPKKVRSLTDAEIENSRQAVRSQVKSVRKVFQDLQIDFGIRNLIQGVFGPNRRQDLIMNSLGAQFRSFVFAEVFFQGFSVFNRFFQSRKFFAIPELIPEVVYHEYAHYAFQDSLVPSHSVPAHEAIANFFAALMIDDPNIGSRFKRAFRGKKTSGESQDLYDLSADSLNNVWNDFAFSFRWQLQSVCFAHERDVKTSEMQFFPVSCSVKQRILSVKS